MKTCPAAADGVHAPELCLAAGVVVPGRAVVAADEAGELAGKMKQAGQMWVLLPRALSILP